MLIPIFQVMVQTVLHAEMIALASIDVMTETDDMTETEMDILAAVAEVHDARLIERGFESESRLIRAEIETVMYIEDNMSWLFPNLFEAKKEMMTFSKGGLLGMALDEWQFKSGT